MNNCNTESVGGLLADPAVSDAPEELGRADLIVSPGSSLAASRAQPPADGPMWARDRQHALAAREAEMKVAAKVADQKALAELMAFAERSEAPSPARAREMVVSAIASAISSTDRDNTVLPIRVSKVQQMVPEAYGSFVVDMARDGFFLTLVNLGADQSTTNLALVQRGELIRELGLTTFSELMALDLALRHWVEGRQAMARAQQAPKPSDYLKLTQAAQAADKLYESMLQRLRVRHQPRVATIRVGHAASLAIQVNEAGLPNGGEANRTRSVPSRQVGEVPAVGISTRDFDKTN
jgi:hypothetical protein